MTPGVLVVGAGMIVHDQVLPSLYQLQRLGRIGAIEICASRYRSIEALAASETLARAFPGQSFCPQPDSSSSSHQPELFRQRIAHLAPRQIVFVAVPDQLHYQVIQAALASNQHVLSVKPLVLDPGQGAEIAAEAGRRGLFVGIDYHKRFDDRSLMARRAYREGRFGEFRLGSACLLEKWYYRNSNFQNWMTAEHSDAFTYIGCHYVDLVHFITGLEPAAVSVYGIRDRFPNGAEAYLWTDARVIWTNGACLNVQNALGFPDAAPGSNIQGLTLYCQAKDGGGWLAHSDQYRGLQYCLCNPVLYAEPSPDYFQYVDLGGPGLVPVGYGFRSIERMVATVADLENGSVTLEEIDRAGIVATPRNSAFNDRVIHAARQSILQAGRLIEVQG
ncbi:MAG: Gfo/Idh/MocA family oxidoreductase [Bryobacteraceae bacterium]|jgi:predicted dehydrogenase